MTKQYESEVLASVHEAALGLSEAGLMSKRTMRKFDEMCLTPVREMTPEDIRALRLREHASQAVFARYLNVTTGLVSQWERGEKRPRGASLKLLTLVGEERSGGGSLTDIGRRTLVGGGMKYAVPLGGATGHEILVCSSATSTEQ